MPLALLINFKFPQASYSCYLRSYVLKVTLNPNQPTNKFIFQVNMQSLPEYPVSLT